MMMKEKIADPKTALKDSKTMILLSRRFNTGFMDGWYGLPAGHVRPTERIHETVMREVMHQSKRWQNAQ